MASLETDLRTEEKGLPVVFPLNVVPMIGRALVEPEHRVVDVEHLCLDLHVGRRVIHDRAVELPVLIEIRVPAGRRRAISVVLDHASVKRPSQPRRDRPLVVGRVDVREVGRLPQQLSLPPRHGIDEHLGACVRVIGIDTQAREPPWQGDETLGPGHLDAEQVSSAAVFGRIPYVSVEGARTGVGEPPSQDHVAQTLVEHAARDDADGLQVVRRQQVVIPGVLRFEVRVSGRKPAQRRLVGARRADVSGLVRCEVRIVRPGNPTRDGEANIGLGVEGVAELHAGEEVRVVLGAAHRLEHVGAGRVAGGVGRRGE